MTDVNLGGITLSASKDEKGIYISVYDVWNFGEEYNDQYDVKGWKKIQAILIGAIGESFGIYDRYYLDETAIKSELERRKKD